MSQWTVQVVGLSGLITQQGRLGIARTIVLFKVSKCVWGRSHTPGTSAVSSRILFDVKKRLRWKLFVWLFKILDVFQHILVQW